MLKNCEQNENLAGLKKLAANTFKEFAGLEKIVGSANFFREVVEEKQMLLFMVFAGLSFKGYRKTKLPQISQTTRKELKDV